MPMRRSNGRARVMMFADANFLAHVSRVLEIARVLRHESDREVLFAGTGPFMALAVQAGFAVHDCFTVPGDETLALANRASLVDPFWWHRVVQRSIQSDIDLIARERPDVVVGDMHWSLKAAAMECGVPYVSIVNGAWTKYFDVPLAAFDDHILTTTLGRALATRMLPAFKHAAMWYWALPYKLWGISRRHTNTATRTLFDLLQGDVTLLPDVPEFCPTRNRPATVDYIGPVLWNAPLEPPSWLATLDRSRPTVYASMGSTGSVAFFDVIHQAFAHTEYQVIVTTGSLPWRAPAQAANFFVTDFAPGLPLLSQSHVCINHGGNGTVYQALSAATPIVGVAGHVDQQIQLQLCEIAGVGRRVSRRQLTPATLRAAVDSVVADASCKQRAADMQRAIARYNGPRVAAQAIDALIGVS